MQSIYQAFTTYLIKEDVESAVQLIKQKLEQGIKAEHLLHDVLERAIFQVGVDQIVKAIPLSEIYLNGRIIQLALDEILPHMQGKKLEYGTIVLGNAFGDYHALGRRIISSFLKLGGFNVIDGIASNTVLRKDQFVQFAFGTVKEAIQKIRVLVIYESVGSGLDIIELIHEAGAAAMILDYADRLLEAHNRLDNRKMAIMGNLNNISSIKWSNVKMKIEVKRMLFEMEDYHSSLPSKVLKYRTICR